MADLGKILSFTALRLLIVTAALAGGCAATPRVDDPLAELASIESTPNRQLAAMAILDSQPTDEAYLRLLRGMIHQPGYTTAVREAALERLIQHDLKGLKSTIETRLPMLGALEWRRRLCEIIAEHGWVDLSPTLARAWATPIGGWADKETDRPEYLALASLHGPENVIDVVYGIFMDARGVDQKGLRARCWELLLRLGQRERLAALLRNGDIPADDVTLLDLRAGLEELGVLPINREEILRLSELRQPAHAEFWSQASQAAGQISADKRAELELRTLPVIVAAWLHEPQVLQTSTAQLYQEVNDFVRSEKRHAYTVNFDGFAGEYSQQLFEWRDKLTWGDLAAMRMAVRALRTPQVVDHLFDYADRDLADKSTEYGGLIRLDAQNRFEVVEFLPRMRFHDNRFDAPPEMFDAGVTALFHFHFHAQRYNNDTYAGPHLGDLTYADSTRANCLVFTFINADTLNVDFYRHDRVIVDLGEIHRSERAKSKIENRKSKEADQ